MRAAYLAFFLIAFSAQAASVAADLPEIQQRGVLRVVVARQNGGVPARSPFYGVDDNGPLGFERDMLERFARARGLRVQAVVVSGYDQLIPELLADQGDLIAGSFTVTEGRKKLLDFTTEVLPTRNIVVTRKPHRVVDSIEQLRQEKVGTAKGTSEHEAILKAAIPPANVDDSLTIPGLPDALRARRITAALMEPFGALSAQQQDPDLQLGMLLGPPQSLALGVRKDEPQLLKALDAYITGGRSSNLWYDLLIKYFGKGGPEMLRRSRK